MRILFLIFFFYTFSASAQTTINPAGLSLIGKYNPKNSQHMSIVNPSKILCLDKFKDRIRNATKAAENSVSKEAGFAIIKDAMRLGIDDVGICTYDINYNFSVYEMRTITGMDADISSIQASKNYKQERDESAKNDTAICSKVKYKALSDMMADSHRFEKDGPELLIDMRIYCMALLGRQAGVAKAMRYFDASLN